jgi:predicted secreted protein
MILELACGTAATHAASRPHGANTTVVLTEQAAVGQTRVGVPVEIRLRVQPGTGFSWFPKNLAPNLTAMRPIRGLAVPGGWQIQRFRFLAKHAGTYRLTFSYDQPWARGTKGARSLTFTVRAL